MKQNKDNTVIRTAHGKTLPTPIPYNWTWETFENVDELIDAKRLMTNEEQLDFRNTQAASNARSKAYQAALEASGIVKPTAENDVQVALLGTYKMLVAAKLKDGSRKYTDEQAKTEAESLQDATFEKSPF